MLQFQYDSIETLKDKLYSRYFLTFYEFAYTDQAVQQKSLLFNISSGFDKFIEVVFDSYRSIVLGEVYYGYIFDYFG